MEISGENTRYKIPSWYVLLHHEASSAKQNHSGMLIAAIFNMVFPDSCSIREEVNQPHTYCRISIPEHPGFKLQPVGAYVFVVNKVKLY